jgi:hypothetical protein
VKRVALIILWLDHLLVGRIVPRLLTVFEIGRQWETRSLPPKIMMDRKSFEALVN